MTAEKRKDDFLSLQFSDTMAWRNWLIDNGKTHAAVWLIFNKKHIKPLGLTYKQALEEAICLGWIDGRINARDQDSYCILFAPRNPKSRWSRVNKNLVEQLEKAGRMMPAGSAVVAAAKKNGQWEALDAVEDLQLPPDLQEAFAQQPVAYENWEKFPRSIKRGILEWLLTAKLADTRLRRIQTIIEQASQNKRALFDK